MSGTGMDRLFEVRAFGSPKGGSIFNGVTVGGPGDLTYHLMDSWGEVGVRFVSPCCTAAMDARRKGTGVDPDCLPLCLRCGSPVASLAPAVRILPQLLEETLLTREIAEALLSLSHDVLTASLLSDQLLREAQCLVKLMLQEPWRPAPACTLRDRWRKRAGDARRQARVVAEFERERALL